MEKDVLRKQMKGLRKQLSEYERSELSGKIFKKILGLSEYKKASAVCVYMDSFGEVKTDLILKDLRACGKEIVFPVSDKNTHTLTLCRDCGEFVAGAYGIWEPARRETVDFSYPDLVIVPGLAFDRNKNRLGFGAGYYDRFLSESGAFKIGICYGFQLVEKIACEEHDIKMDIIITEQETVLQ